MRQTPLRRKNFGPYKISRDEARRLWSLAIRILWGRKCARCGRTEAAGYQIDAAHILGVGAYPTLKYLVGNGIPLCAMKCHKWYDASKNRLHDGESDLWVKGVIGEDQYAKLLIQARVLRRPDKAIVRAELRAFLKTLEAADLGVRR